jgi:hypothetical protein
MYAEKKGHPVVENADGRENKYVSAVGKQKGKKEKNALLVPESRV